jgi:type III secretion protein J
MSVRCISNKAEAARRMDARVLRWVFPLLAIALLCACRVELHARLTERDANQILSALYAAGIPANKHTSDEKTWSVEVDEQDLQRALYVVREQGLPRESFANTGELFKKQGLISTPSEERIRHIYAMSQELANTLSQIDGVVVARVHPVIPANDPLATKVRPASASVFIKHRREADLTALAPAIRNLVMRGIEGLAYENIALTFVSAEETDTSAGLPLLPGRPDSSGVWTGVLLMLLAGSLGALLWVWNKYRIAIGRVPLLSKADLKRVSQWWRTHVVRRVQPQ